MALTKGDGPNRGQAAPRKLAPAAPREAAPRTISEALGRSATVGTGLTNRPLEVIGRNDEVRRNWDALHPPALAPRSKAAAQAYNADITAAEGRKQQRDSVALMYDNMAARQKTAEARAAREASDRQEQPKALTADEWIKMSPLQQAGVQANADLADAIRRDIEGQYKHHATTKQIETYQDRVRELFGDLGVGYKGIEYAPNTVAFLNERGFTKDDLAGKSLDDFISGDVLSTGDVVSRLGKEQSSQDVFKTQDSDLAFAQRLAAGQLNYQEKLASALQRGKQLLTDTTADRTNLAAGEAYGAQQPDPVLHPDIRPETAAQLDMYMEALARTDSPVDQALSAINLDLQQRGASPKETEQVFSELLQRSKQGMTGDGRWFDGLDFPMRNPVEVAQALGSPVLRRMSEGEGRG